MTILSLLKLGLYAVQAFSATVSFDIKNMAKTDELVNDAVVIADPIPAMQIPRANGKVYVLSQRDKKFAPFVLPIEVGAKVRFPNEDSFAHSVYAVSAAKSFELPLYKKSDSEPPPVSFDKPGNVVLGCNIHDNMIGHILVLATPHFSLSQAGKAQLVLPSGQYKIRTWHPRMNDKEPIVTIASLIVQGDSAQTISISLKEEKVKRALPSTNSYTP